MLVVRFLLILGLIAVTVACGAYLLTRDRRYLRLAWQLARLSIVLLLVIAAVIALGRIVLY